MALDRGAGAAGLLFAVDDDVEHEVARFKHAGVGVGTAELVAGSALIFPTSVVVWVNNDWIRAPCVAVGPPAVTFIPAREARAPIGVAWVSMPAWESSVTWVPAGSAGVETGMTAGTPAWAAWVSGESAAMSGGRVETTVAWSRMETAVAWSRMETAVTWGRVETTVAGSRMKSATTDVSAAGSGMKPTAATDVSATTAAVAGFDKAIRIHRLSAVEDLF